MELGFTAALHPRIQKIAPVPQQYFQAWRARIAAFSSTSNLFLGRAESVVCFVLLLRHAVGVSEG